MIAKILLVVDLTTTVYKLIKEARQDIDEIYEENRHKKRKCRMNGHERRAKYRAKLRGEQS